MDMRKLQQTGGASLTITLPKKWIAKNSLKDKDILRVVESKLNYLILEPVKTERKL